LIKLSGEEKGTPDTCSHVFDSEGKAVKREVLLRLRRQQLEFLHERAVIAAHRHALPVPVGYRSSRSFSQPKQYSSRMISKLLHQHHQVAFGKSEVGWEWDREPMFLD